MKRILFLLPIEKDTEATTAARATFAKDVPPDRETFLARYSPTGREPATHLAACGLVSDLELSDFKADTATALDITATIWDDERDPAFARKTLEGAGLKPVIPDELPTP